MNESEDGLNVAPSPTGDERKARSRAQYDSQRGSASYYKRKPTINSETKYNGNSSYRRRTFGNDTNSIVNIHDEFDTHQFNDFSEAQQTYGNDDKPTSLWTNIEQIRGLKDFNSVKTDPDIVSYTKTKDDEIVNVEEAIEEQVTTKRNKINDRGSVRWAQYSGGKVCDTNGYGTEREYAEAMYRCKNSIVRRLMAFDCDDTTPREKKDEAVRLGNGMYPTMITEASARRK